MPLGGTLQQFLLGGLCTRLKVTATVTCKHGVCMEGSSSRPSVFRGQWWRVTSQSMTLLLLQRWMGQWRGGSFSLRGRLGGRGRRRRGGGVEGYDTDQSRHGSRMSRAKKPKLGAKGGAILPPKVPPASTSAPLREHLKDTQQQLKARIEELEKVRKQSAQAQKAAKDMLREERVKWEEERREKDSEIRDLRVKLQDASVRASKKGPASPGPGEGGKDVEDQRSFLQLAAMEIRDGLVQATTSIEDLRDSLIDARGKESTQGQKTLSALTSLKNKYTVQSLQLGKAVEQPTHWQWRWRWRLNPRGCCSALLSHMFFVGGVGWGVAVQGQVGSTIAFRDVWGGAAWQCPCGCCNTQLPKGVPGHQCLRARTVAIVVHLDCRPSEPHYFPFKHYARAQAPGPPALECHCDCW